MSHDQTVRRTPKPVDFRPDQAFPKNHVHFGKPRCQAWSNNNGRQCLGLAVRGRRVCAVHGGKTPSGLAAPGYKDGRYAKYLPPRLQTRYEAGASDPEYLALREDINLVTTRIIDLLGRIEIGESGELWHSLRSRMDDYNRFIRHAQSIKDEERKKQKFNEAGEALSDVQSLIIRGAAEWQIWTEIEDALERRRRLVETERRRLVDMQQMITAEQAYDLVTSMSLAVVKHKGKKLNQDVLREIVNDFVRLANRPGVSDIRDRDGVEV